MSEAEKALDALGERLSLIYRLCCGTAPKQAVGELVAVMQTMPEWGVIRAQLAAQQMAAK